MSEEPLPASTGKFPGNGPKFLQVVVGAGIVPYFENAVRSCIEVQHHDVLGIYNYLDRKDRDGFENFRQRYSDNRATLLSVPNDSTNARVGGLYGAYNDAMSHARGRYDYVHFIQSDMQLMRWTEETERQVAQLFSSEKTSSEKILCISSAFPCRGKFTENQYRSAVFHHKVLGSMVMGGVGMADVGIWDVEKFFARKMSFYASEGAMSEDLANDGFVLPLLSHPVSAFLPWPAVVRNNKVRGDIPKVDVSRNRLLTLESGARIDSTTDIPWMENEVFPHQWSTLFPYWPTSIWVPKWVNRRSTACSELERPIFSSIGPGSRRNSSFLSLFQRNFHPRPTTLGKAILLAWVATARFFTQKLLLGMRAALARRLGN